MSLNLIPLRRDRRKHSPDTVIRKLRDENRKHLTRQMAADDYFALLVQDRDQTYQAWQFAEEKRGEAEQAAAAMQTDRDAWRDEALRLRAQLAPYKAAEANANRVDVPCAYRDTSDPSDQATAPIDVRPLWEALGIGPVTDPGHTH